MAQTLVKNLLHLVFSTKNRLPLIRPEIESELFAYMTGTIKGCDSKLLIINGTEDHVHLLVSLSKNWSLSALLENLKKDSSKWIKTKGPHYRNFYWQEGYGAFSIGESTVATAKRYIERQKQHHRHKSFQEELLTLLQKYDIPYDERYLWT